MAASRLLMFAAVIDEMGLPSAHDRGIVPWIVLDRTDNFAREVWGEADRANGCEDIGR